MAQSGELPAPWAGPEASPPSTEVITSMGKIRCDWSNTTLMRFEDPYENHIEYNDGETLHQLNLLDDDWERLAEQKYPWEYWPDMSRFDASDLIRVTYGKDTYNFRPKDTKLRLFDDQSFNHVEHQLNPGNLRGLTVVPALWRMMFKGDYPIKYLPFVDKATREWAEAVGLK